MYLETTSTELQCLLPGRFLPSNKFSLRTQTHQPPSHKGTSQKGKVFKKGILHSQSTLEFFKFAFGSRPTRRIDRSLVKVLRVSLTRSSLLSTCALIKYSIFLSFFFFFPRKVEVELYNNPV